MQTFFVRYIGVGINASGVSAHGFVEAVVVVIFYAENRDSRIFSSQVSADSLSRGVEAFIYYTQSANADKKAK